MKARFLALAALVLGLASCQNDPEIVNPVVDGEVDFQLAVGVPELNTRAAENGTNDSFNHANSAYGAIDYLQGVERGDDYRTDWDEVDIRYSLEVYDVADNYTDAVPVKDRQVIIKDSYEPVAFDLRLVPGREYHFVVFADFVDQGADANPAIGVQEKLGLHHNIGANLGKITIKNDGINDECTDAYFAVKDITISNSAAQDMELKRPYGKLRVVATDLAELNINVDPAAVVVTYDAYHPNAFNAVTGEISGKYEPKEYVSVYNKGVCKLIDGNNTGLANHFYTEGYDNMKATNKDGVQRHTHMTLFTDYILANEQQAPIHFTMNVYQTATKNGEEYVFSNPIKETHFNTEIPIQRNFLTTIVGNVLTTATEIKVTIDDNFAGETVIKDDVVNNAESFAAALAAAAEKEYASIELVGDIEWETGAGIGSTPFVAETAKTKSLVINGNGRTLTATGKGVGSIRMANGGTLTFNNVVIVDKSVSYAENSWEYGYLEFGGNLAFNNCEFKNAIMVENEGNATFNGCKFNSNDANQYDAWVSEAKVYFNNCDIEGYRGIKLHEAYGSEIVEAVIDNCRFNSLSKKPGVAMGDLNAETKVVIKNSTFTDCQKGDQGLYIYETDTDVTSFDFTEENNTVVLTANDTDSIKEALANGADEVAVAAGEYTFPASSVKAGQTIICEEGTVFTGNSKLNISGATVIGAKFSNPSGTAVDQAINGTFKDCTFTGSNALRWCYAGENCVFEDCVFDGNTYGVHFDGGENPVTFRNCVFSGFNAFATATPMVTFEGCTFVGNGKSGYNGANLWGSATLKDCEFTFNGSTEYEWIDCIGADKTYSFENCTVNGVAYTADNYSDYLANIESRNEITVKINGVDCAM